MNTLMILIAAFSLIFIYLPFSNLKMFQFMQYCLLPAKQLHRGLYTLYASV